MLRFAFHTPGADVTQGMRTPATSVPLRHRANHRSGEAGPTVQADPPLPQ